MKIHWGFVLLVALGFYLIGSWMPGPGRKLYGLVGLPMNG